MQTIKYMLFLLVFWSCLPVGANASSTLQSRIDAAPEGAVIEVESGEYEETLDISKPITLAGKGDPVLRSCGNDPVISISGKDVTLRDIRIDYCGDEKEESAIYVTGSGHVLERLEVTSTRLGIRLDQAFGAKIHDSTLTGIRRGNGIDLWKSNGNQISSVKIKSMSDGIYLEQSNENTLSGNQIEGSRYGMHLMYSNDNVLEGNLSKMNITGTMLMEAERTVVRGNQFSSNNNSVNAQGLLLYDATETEVSGNEFISNRLGMYIEKAENNRLESNKIMDNFIGIQFKEAKGNEASQNTFVGNVNDVQAIESFNNQLDSNYWDAADKVDADGDGKSEIPLKADPYFLTLTADVPEFQLFFQSPGLILLQKMLKSPADQLLTDSAPLMDMTMEVSKEHSSAWSLWIICLLMLAGSYSLFLIGRKRK